MQGMELMILLFGPHIASTLGVEGTSNKNENKNNILILQDPLLPKKRRLEEGLAQNQVKKQVLQGTEPLGMGGMQQAVGKTLLNNVPASFTFPVSHQPPLAIPRTNINGHHGYGPGAVPSLVEGFHNPSVQPQLFPSQSFQGFVATSHQNAVAPIGNGAIHPLPPPASHNPYIGDHALANHRRF